MIPPKPFNPLDKGNLGASVRDALLHKTPVPMSNLLEKAGTRYVNRFSGAGIYAIYYVGAFPACRAIVARNANGQFSQPIYVGKAVPQGSRKGGLIDEGALSDALFDRLRIHAQTLIEAENLDIADFFYRYLAVDDIWIPLGETYMIETFRPLWNKILDGFGNKTPGKRRSAQYMSLWDTVHSGRGFVQELNLPKHPKSLQEILNDIHKYLSMPDTEKASIPIIQDGPGQDK